MFSLTLTALKLFLLCVPCYGRGVVIAFFVQTSDWLSKRHEINLYRMRRTYQLKSFRGALFLLAFDLWFFKNFNDSCRELVHYCDKAREFDVRTRKIRVEMQSPLCINKHTKRQRIMNLNLEHKKLPVWFVAASVTPNIHNNWTQHIRKYISHINSSFIVANKEQFVRCVLLVHTQICLFESKHEFGNAAISVDWIIWQTVILKAFDFISLNIREKMSTDNSDKQKFPW